MKAWDFYAVVYSFENRDADVYCNECLPQGITTDHPHVTPIFASSEWDHYPVCCVCGREHDYVGLTEEGYEEMNGI